MPGLGKAIGLPFPAPTGDGGTPPVGDDLITFADEPMVTFEGDNIEAFS